MNRLSQKCNYMSMEQAIKKEWNTSLEEWNQRYEEPTSVRVGFLSVNPLGEIEEDETELDLYAVDKARELIQLWADLCHEMGSALHAVLYVNTLGAIV